MLTPSNGVAMLIFVIACIEQVTMAGFSLESTEFDGFAGIQELLACCAQLKVDICALKCSWLEK